MIDDFAFDTFVRISGLTRRASALLLCSVISGCAHTANDYYAKPMDAYGRLAKDPKTSSGLVISGEEVRGYASADFGVVDLTFENETSDWVHIRAITLGFGGGKRDEAVLVPAGEQITSWYLATEHRNAIRETNTELALGGLAAGGTAVAATSSNKAARTVGGAVALGSLVALTAQGIHSMVQEAEHAYPSEHLLNVPFSVPPHLFTKRWVVLNTKGGSDTPCIRAMLIDYETDRHVRDRVWLTFRHRASEWQRKACRDTYTDARR